MIYKRGGVYWFEFYYAGERVRMSTHQHNAQVARDAQAAERMRRVKGEHGIDRKELSKIPTLEGFKEIFTAWVNSEKDNLRTRVFYASCYTRLCDFRPLGKTRLDKIDEALIENFKDWALEREHTRTTANRYLATLKKALRYAMRKRRIIDRVPMIELYPHERSREYVFSDAAYSHWLEIAPEPLRSASVLAHDSGICRGEMLALRRDCVTLRDEPKGAFWGSLNIRRGLKRAARRRDVPITQDMAVVLHKLLDRSKCECVFTSLEDPKIPLSRNVLGDQHRRMMKTGEFDPDAGLHALRHSFLTEAGRYTQNVRALQILAGHANIATTMKYVHPDGEDVVSVAHQVHAARAARESVVGSSLDESNFSERTLLGSPQKSPQSGDESRARFVSGRLQTCESGGIGRRTRLRIWRVKPWGFESPLSHQLLLRAQPSQYQPLCPVLCPPGLSLAKSTQSYQREGKRTFNHIRLGMDVPPGDRD